jgi:glycine oxidase
MAARGRRVAVIDPATGNASSVAAGMIAPVMETVLDGADAARAILLLAARDLWPDFAAATGIALYREGAEWRGGDVEAIQARIEALGFTARATRDGLFIADDWRLDPVQALAALWALDGITRIYGQATAIAPTTAGWRVSGPDFGPVQAKAVVAATGWSPRALAAPDPVPELLELIHPIRGQLEHIAGPGLDHVVRGPNGYVAPAPGGVVSGASMQPGETDISPDAALSARYVEAARDLIGTATVASVSRVGIRGASPDGLPIAGLVAPGLAVALAPRRNGWLLGPLVADIVADALDGRAPGPWAGSLDPARFL